MGAAPASLAGFPSTAVLDVVHAEARFYTNHQELFDEDLIRAYGVVPISLRLWIGRGASLVEEPRKSLRDMGLQLYLVDGTICSPASAERIARRRQRTQNLIDDRVLQDGFIGTADQAREEFVFFEVPGIEEYDADSQTVTLRSGGIRRTVDLSRSLLVFDLLVERELRPVHIGLNRSRWTRGRQMP